MLVRIILSTIPTLKIRTSLRRTAELPLPLRQHARPSQKYAKDLKTASGRINVGIVLIPVESNTTKKKRIPFKMHATSRTVRMVPYLGTIRIILKAP